MRDPNLFLNVPEKRLELTTTNSDINVQINMPTGEYFGIPLADLGFTGREDFAISVTIPDIPALQRVGQFGLYAGDRSNRMIRGGLIRAIEKRPRSLSHLPCQTIAMAAILTRCFLGVL